MKNDEGMTKLPMFIRTVRAIVNRWPEPLFREAVYRIYRQAARERPQRIRAVTDWGGVFDCDTRDSIQTRILLFGVWEPALTTLLLHDLMPGDLVIDVGANIGYFSVLAGRLVGGSGRVVAIEPSPIIAAALQKTIELNGLSNVEIIAAAASDRASSVRVYAGPPENRGSTSVSRRSVGPVEATVRADTLENLITTTRLHQARLIKIDVEGSEGRILESLLPHLALLTERSEIVVEVSPEDLERQGIQFEAVMSAFTFHGFHPFTIPNPSSIHAYRRRVPVALERLYELPTKRTDILFSRRRGERISLRRETGAHPDNLSGE